MYCQHCFTESPNTSPRCIQCGEAFFSKEEMSSPRPNVQQKGGFGVLGWTAGLVVGLYSGIFLLMLLASTIAISYLGKKLFNPSVQIYLTAIALQAGQILLLMIFGLILPFVTTVPIHLDIFLLFDVVVPIAGLTWLVLKPGFKPIVFLTIFQACALVANGLNFSEMTVGDLNHKALATHILWRCLALFMMWQSYIATKDINARSPDIAP